MEPGHEDREYHAIVGMLTAIRSASMEPGHEDREYLAMKGSDGADAMPQWSPVMKTGNTPTLSTSGLRWTSLNGARS